MIRSLLASVLGVLVSVALVGPPARAADDIETTVQGCSLCHGKNGDPTDPKIVPIIWGQQSSYLYKELHDYHSGDRKNAVMSLIAQGIALPELRKLADYFAAKSWPARQASAAAGAEPEGSSMCKACHGEHFEGTAAGPRLAGLSYQYLVASMQSFADGARTNNLDMPGFMKALTENQRQAIAHYLAAL